MYRLSGRALLSKTTQRSRSYEKKTFPITSQLAFRDHLLQARGWGDRKEQFTNKPTQSTWKNQFHPEVACKAPAIHSWIPLPCLILAELRKCILEPENDHPLDSSRLSDGVKCCLCPWHNSHPPREAANGSPAIYGEGFDVPAAEPVRPRFPARLIQWNSRWRGGGLGQPLLSPIQTLPSFAAFFLSDLSLPTKPLHGLAFSPSTVTNLDGSEAT